MPNLLATDSSTVTLGIAALGAYFLNSLLTPQSLVHPILLGRQSDVDRVRKSGESAVYRNYGTGLMGAVGRSFSPVCTIVDDGGIAPCETSARHYDHTRLRQVRFHWKQVLVVNKRMPTS